MRSRWPLLLVLVLLWLHRGGWWAGGVYLDEDVAGQFYLLKSRLYLLARGLEPWSWWDPLPLLGSPRLASIQVGWLSPLNLWFVVLSPAWAWRLYPLWIDTLMVGAAWWTLREWGGTRLTASWVAMAWVVSGGILFESQHPCYKEALLASLLSVGCALRYWKYRQRRSWLGLTACGFLHLAVGSPSAVYFDHVCLALLLPALLTHARPPRRVLLSSLLAYLAGCLLAAPALLPLLDYNSHGHRTMAGVAGVAMAESYRMTLVELGMRIASESQVGSPTLMEHGMGYPLPVDYSLALTLLALSALAVPRLRPLLILSWLAMLQSLGERGGLLWLLHKALPITLQFRGPARFYFVGSWGFVVCAGLAWQHWRQHSRSTRLVSDGLAAWALLFSLLAQSQTMHYADPRLLQLPPRPDWHQGRVSALRYSRPQPPLLWESSSVLQGMPTLLMPDSVFERGYLLGLACSQWGENAREKLGPMIHNAQAVPVLKPQAPLLLSWGLTWVLEGEGDHYGWRRLQPDPPRHWFARPTSESAEQWASRSQGDPFATASVEGPVPEGVPSGGSVRVDWESADYQNLRVEGQGLLISADQWDPGWHCFQDGQPVPVLRADLALKACWVPAGVRVVEWRYRAPWWGKFWVIEGLGWTLLLVAWVGFARPARATS